MKDLLKNNRKFKVNKKNIEDEKNGKNNYSKNI